MARPDDLGIYLPLQLQLRLARYVVHNQTRLVYYICYKLLYRTFLITFSWSFLVRKAKVLSLQQCLRLPRLLVSLLWLDLTKPRRCNLNLQSLLKLLIPYRLMPSRQSAHSYLMSKEFLLASHQLLQKL